MAYAAVIVRVVSEHADPAGAGAALGASTPTRRRLFDQQTSGYGPDVVLAALAAGCGTARAFTRRHGDVVGCQDGEPHVDSAAPGRRACATGISAGGARGRSALKSDRPGALARGQCGDFVDHPFCV